jgi:hypothetical protein
VLVANTSAWVDGCPIGPSGLLASMTAAWDSMDVCGWPGMGLRSKAPWQVSFWMACCGCFVELMSTVGTNVRIRSRGLVNPE